MWQNLKDAQLWLTRRPSLPQDERIDFSELDKLDASDWLERLPSEVDRLIAVRRQLLQRDTLKLEPSGSHRGRLLIFYPGYSAHDGIAQYEAPEVFDVHSCPLADYWIGTTNTERFAIVSWIPEIHGDAVSMAIQIQSFPALDWLSYL